MSIQEQIKEVVTTHPIVLFMKGTKQFPQCGFSSRAVQILKAAGCESFATVNVLENDEVRQGIKEYSNWPTIPQLYVKGEFVGGADILAEMFEELLKTVEASFFGWMMSGCLWVFRRGSLKCFCNREIGFQAACVAVIRARKGSLKTTLTHSCAEIRA